MRNILFFILKNYENQYLDGFPHENIADEIGKDTLLRNIKDFYSYKGTDLSIEFLFRALFCSLTRRDSSFSRCVTFPFNVST